MNLVKTAKIPRSIEALLEVFFNLFAVYVVYQGFNWFVIDVFNQELAGDTLLSLLLLPALYILKDLNPIDPLTVVVERYPDKISVKRGISPRVRDTLEFRNVENIEVITTLLGSILGYSTIILYSPGGLVEMPYVYQADKIVSIINRARKST